MHSTPTQQNLIQRLTDPALLHRAQHVASLALPYLEWALGLSLVMLLFKPTRDLIIWTYGRLLTPAVIATVGKLILWVWWVIKKIVRAHIVVIRNLTLPRRRIYPSLERPEDGAG